MNDHLLRKIDRFVDLSEVRAHLEPYYSEIGRPSIDPELMIRMLIVGWILIPLASAMPLRSVAIGAGVGGRVCHSSRARQGGVIRTKRAARTKRRIEVKRQLFLEAGVVGPSEYMTSVDVRPSNQRTLITEAGKRTAPSAIS